MGHWDSKLKLLISTKPQEFVSWLVEGARYQSEVSPHLQARNIDADILYQITIDDRPYLLHIEFQIEADQDMAEQIWEYNVLATRKYALPVYSFVIYLKKKHNIVESPYVCLGHGSQEIHQFHFAVIKLWEIPTAQMKDLGFQSLFPLLPLTREGKKREVVEGVMRELSSNKQDMPKDLIVLAFGLASLIFNSKDDQEWLQRRFGMLDDLLRESWAFRDFFEEGKQAGLKEGIVLSRQTVVALVEHYYPSLVALAKEKVEEISDQQRLQQLILQIGIAPHQQAAQTALEML